MEILAEQIIILSNLVKTLDVIFILPYLSILFIYIIFPYYIHNFFYFNNIFIICFI